MTTVRTYGEHEPSFYEDQGQGQGFDLAYLLGIAKRRILYFVIPFVLICLPGIAIVEIQRPIYRAEGTILVESPEIPPDLVRPSINELADQRVAVLKQRILARDNLLKMADKFGLFPRERQSMSTTEFVEMLRSHVEIKPAALDTQALVRSSAPTVAFTVSFEHEDPAVAAQVANEFLTEILSDDATRRTKSATDTTNFLQQEVKRLETEHDSIVAQLQAAEQQPPDEQQTISEQVKAQMKSLADLEKDLVQKQAIYSEEHPAVRSLKKQISALKAAIAATPQRSAASEKSATKSDVAAEFLKQQRVSIERSLDEANRKLAAARLGESMERNQQAERLRVIDAPSTPHRPIRPKKLKWFAIVLALSGFCGVGCAVAAEFLDGSIRSIRELYGVVDRRLITTVPYLSSPAEERRKRQRLFLGATFLLLAIFATVVGLAYSHLSIDFFASDQHWLHWVARLGQ
jgi:uncharacterized protein involved in exopolysaccharide biosynthesis